MEKDNFLTETKTSESDILYEHFYFKADHDNCPTQSGHKGTKIRRAAHASK